MDHIVNNIRLAQNLTYASQERKEHTIQQLDF